MLSVVSANELVDNNTISTANGDLDTISVANDQEGKLGESIGTFADLEFEIGKSGNSLSLEGNYTYFIGDVDVDDGIVIDKNITIDGKGYTIDAANSVSIFNIKGNSKVILQNINFINAKGSDGGAIKLDPSTHLEIINCNFTNNMALGNGGAIYVTNSTSMTSNLTITESNFINNTARSGGAIYLNENSHDVSLIENSKFINCTSSGDGGAAYINASYVEFRNVLFIDNVAGDDGGALYWEGDNGIIYNITCVNNRGISATKKDGNTSSTRGGTICLTGDNVIINMSSFTLGSAYMDAGKDTSKVDGGAIFVTGNDVTITDTTFDKCNTTNDAGALYVLGNNTHIIHCTFNNNTGSDGGALYVMGINCTLYDSTFTDNVAGDDGGAIFWEGDNGIIYNITCTNNKGISITKPDGNTSSTRGGTICLVGSNVTVSKSYFTLGSAYIDEGKNSSKVDGGAIFATGNDVTIRDTTFDKCNATNSGGALYVLGNSTHIINCTFSESTAKDGAALYVDGKDCTLYDSTFTDNTANDDGGAIFWQGGNGYMYNIRCVNNNGVSYNTSSSRGGAICLTGDNVTLTKSSFTSSNVYAGSGDTSKIDGGALFITGNNVNVYETEFYNCSAVNFGGAIYIIGHETKIWNCTFNDTTALVGGGIFIAGNKGVVDDSVFRYNTAEGPAGGSGGAVYIEGDDATISNSDFAHNNVINYGGAISVWGKNANITRNVFDNCTTTLYYGGAIYVNGANTTISLSNFTRNRANNDYARGGAIEVSGDEAHIVECNFEECYAFYGGIIHVSGSNTLINSSNFKNSTAFDGGAIYVEGVNSHILDSNFSNLTSERFGGAIFVSGSDAIVNASYFEDITSDQGGAIYISGSDAMVYESTFKDDSAHRGGAIYVFGPRTTILKSNFTDINSEDYGGAIFVAGSNANISQSDFLGCKVKKYNGGAIYIEGADTTIEKSNFTLCEGLSKTAQGGAIYVYGANTLINDSYFDRCTAIEGGDIYVFGNHAEIQNSGFNSSTANLGGAIYLYAWGAIVRTSEIENCIANKDGGAIYVYGGGVYILESQFDDCMAKGESSTDGGGAIYVLGPDSHIANSTFNNNRINKGSARGGAVYIKGEGTFIEDSDFNNSFAHQGGVIYIEGENAIVNSSSFANSSSTSFGGAISVNGHNATIEWSTFDTIHADQHGGAIYVDGEETKILQSSFDHCTVKNDKYGGAIYIDDKGTTIAFSNFTHSHANTGGAIYINGENTTITYCNLDNNTASSAGAIKVFGNDTILSNCNFTYNLASGDGGALDIGGSNASVFYSWFDNNQAGSKGGAINWLGGHGDDSISGSNFTNNRCNDTRAGGGAIYWTAAKVIASGGLIQNSIFINNTAVHHGGAIDWFQAKDSTINNCRFINNTAYGDGGALYTGDQGGNGHHLNMSNSVFYNNTAMKHGGAIANQMSDSWVYNNTFDGNKAMGSGGTIIMKEGPAKNSVIDHCYIYNSFSNESYSGNTYGVGGGAIRIKDDGITISNCAIINSTAAKFAGGAIIVDSGNKNTALINVTIQNVETRDGPGGAIYWGGKDGIINNITIFNSSSSHVSCGDWKVNGQNYLGNGNGGAIYLAGSNCNFNDIKIFDSSSTNNYTKSGKTANGGSIYVAGSSNKITNLEIDVSNASSNKMNAKGGAVYWSGASGTLINATISNTLANGQGGAIYWIGTSPNVDNLSISYSQTNVTNSANSADGGAIYATTINDLKNVYIIDSIASKDKGDVYGGAIYYNGANMHNVTVVGSRAVTDNGTSYGGAVYWTGGSKGNIYDSLFENNTANLGGALVSDRDVSITDTAFVGNVALDGGAIYTQKGNLALTNVSFDLNSAKRGGAIFAKGVLFEILDSHLRNNTAEEKGGAIYIYDADQLSYIKNTPLTNNTAFQGSAIYTDKFFKLIDVILLDNQANSNKFIDKHVGVDEQGKNYTSAVFVGYDNVLNAIWCEEELISIACSNVTYWSANGRNVSNSIPTRRDREAGINITVEMYNGDGEQINSSRLVTDEFGRVKYQFDYNYGDTVYFAYVHDSDRYYTSLRDTLSNSSLVKIYLTDPLYYGQNQTIRIDLGDGAWGKLSGNVSVKINDTKYKNFTVEVINGTAYLYNLSGWVLGQYNVSAEFKGDKDHTGDTDWIVFTVLPYTDVGITKTVNITADYVNVTDIIEYTINVTNHGPSKATGVNVTEELSPYLRMIKNETAHGYYNLTNGYWYIGDLEINETAILTITAEVIHVGPITNTVWVRIDGMDINKTNDNSTAHNFTALPIVDLRITKEINASYAINVTDVIKYTIIVYNDGPCNATGVVVGEVLDYHLELISNTTTAGKFKNGTWTIGNLANGTNATLTIIANVIYSGNITNAVNVTCFENDTDLSNNFANVTNFATAFVDLQINKTVNVTGVVNVTDKIKFTISVYNAGPANASGVFVSEKLNEHLRMIDYNVTIGKYDGATWIIGSLNTGEVHNLTIIAEVISVGNITNEVNITSVDNDTNLTNNHDNITNITAQPIVDLQIIKTVDYGSGIVNVTDQIQFTITVHNNGPCDATGVYVNETLSKLLKVVEGGIIVNAGHYDVATGIWEIGNMTNQSTVMLTIVAKVVSNGTIANVVTVNSTEIDTNMSNNKDSIINITALPIVDVQIIKTVNSSNFVNVSDVIEFNITVHNKGPSNATHVNVSEVLDSNLKLIRNVTRQGYYNVTEGVWHIGTLTNGSTVVLTLVCEVTGNGSISNIVTVNSTENDTNMSNNKDSIYMFAYPIVDVSITKTVNVTSSDVIVIGNKIEFTVTVHNDGPSNATNVWVNETLDSHLRMIDYTATNGTYDGFTWKIGNLDKGHTETLTILAQVSYAGNITNVVIVYSSEMDTNLTNNRDNISQINVTTDVDLEINKTVNVTSKVVNVSDIIKFTITVHNRSPNNASGVYVSEVLKDSPMFEMISYNATHGDYDGFTWNIRFLNAGDTANLTIIAKVIAIGNLSNSVEVFANNDTNESNNKAEVNLTSLPVVDLQVTKVVDFGSGVVNVGELVQFTITVKNNGPWHATGVNVTEKLSPHLKMLGNWTVNGYYNVTEGVWYIGNLNNQSEARLTLQARVISNGTISNVVFVKSNENDTNKSNNNDTIDNITALPVVDLIITKWVNRTVVNVSDRIQYNITVFNNGPSNATQVNVSEVLVSGLKLISNVTKTGYYNVTEGVWYIGKLNNQSTAILTLVCEVIGNGTITNYVEAFSYENDTNYENNHFEVNVTSIPIVDLIINKTVNVTNGMVNVTDYINFTITVKNKGPANATKVNVTEVIDNHLKLIRNVTENGYYDLSKNTWYIGTLNNQSTAVLTLVCEVMYEGLIDNEVIVRSNETDTNLTNNKDNISTINATAYVDLQITKKVNVTSGIVNITDIIEFTITVKNNGPSNATGVYVDETLPSYFHIISNSTSDGSYYDGSAWTINNLNNQASVTLTIVARVEDVGLLSNNVEVFSVEKDTNKSNNKAEVNITSLPIVDLQVTKVVDFGAGSVYVGDLVQFSITIKNNGPWAATNVNVTEVLSPHLKMLANWTWMGYYNVTEGIWHIGDLANQSSVTLTIQSKVISDGIISNVAIANSTENDTNKSNNWDDIDNITALPLVDVQITKTVNVTTGAVNVTDLIEFTITVKNNGPSNATGVNVSEILNPHLKFVSNQTANGYYNKTTGIWHVGNLNNQSSAVLKIVAQVISRGIITNVVIATSTEKDRNMSNNRDQIEYIIASPIVDLEITKTVNVTTGFVNVTDLIEFTITVKNNGPCDAEGVYVGETLNGHLELISNVTTVGKWDGFTWNIGKLLNQSNATLTIVAKVISPGSISNFVYVNGTEKDTNISNNNYTIDNITALPIVDLEIIKVVDFGAGVVSVGDFVQFNITVKNNGPCDATNVNVTEVLSSHLEMVGNWTWMGYYNVTEGIWYIGDLANQSSVTLTIQSRVISDGIISNVVIVNSTENDNNLSNNWDDIDNITALPVVDLNIVKVVSRTLVNVSDIIIFTITVQNDCLCDAHEVNVTEVLDGRLKMTGNTTKTGYYNITEGVWHIGDLPKKSNATLTIVCEVTGDGIIENFVEVFSFENDTAPWNNWYRLTFKALPIVDLAITKTANTTGPVNVTDKIEFTITVHNNGPSTATQVNVTEALSQYLKLISNVTDYGHYDVNEGIWYIGSLANQSTATLTIVAQVVSVGNISNVVTVVSNENDTNKSNDKDNITNITALPIVDLAITKTANTTGPVNVTDKIEFVITVHNNGPCNATGVNVSEVLSQYLKLISNVTDCGHYDVNEGIWYIGSLANQSTATLTIVAQVVSVGNISNVVTVVSNENDTNKSNDQDNITNITALPIVDLAIVKTANTTGPVNVTDLIEFTVTVHNNGPCNATGVNVSEVLSQYLKLISNVTDCGHYDVNEGIWYIGSLANQSTATLTIVAQVVSVGNISNVVIVTSNENDTNKSNDKDNITNITALPIVDLAVTKEVNVTSGIVNVSDYIEFTITVHNNGPCNATGVNVTEILNSNLKLISNVTDHGYYDVGAGIWHVGELANQSTAVLTIVSKVISNGTISNAVIVTSNENDTNKSNNNDSIDNITALPIVDVKVNKTVNVTEAKIGDDITYTIIVQNNGPNDATNVNVTEKLSEYVTLVQYNATQGNYDITKNIWYIGKLTKDSVATLTLTVKIIEAKTIENAVIVNSTENDTNLTNNNYTSDNVTVSKLDTPIELITYDITYGDDEILEIKLPVNATGTVNVTVGKVTYVDVLIDEGIVKLPVTDLAGGDYNVTVVYGGDGRYLPNSTNGSFNVARVTPIITIEVEDIWVWEIEFVNVTVNAPGSVFVTVYGITVEIPLENGVVTTDLLKASAKPDYKGNATWNIIGLPVGTYPAFALYPGNENYTSVNTSDVFIVRDLIPTNVVVTADDIHVGENAIIDVTVGPEGVTGNVTINIEGTNYTVPLENGHATLTVPDLTAGEKLVTVYYGGNVIYRPSQNTTTFDVLKLKPPVDIDSPEITVGEDGVIIVTVPDDATGTITIEINGKRYTEEIGDGEAVFIIPGLEVGVHDIIAFYSGDDKYLPANSTGEIKVNPKEEPDNPNETHKKSTIESTMPPTGNPIMALIAVLMSLCLLPARRFKK